MVYWTGMIVATRSVYSPLCIDGNFGTDAIEGIAADQIIHSSSWLVLVSWRIIVFRRRIVNPRLLARLLMGKQPDLKCISRG